MSTCLTLPAGQGLAWGKAVVNRPMRTTEAAAYVGMSPSSLYKLIKEGRGPKKLNYGLRVARFLRSDLDLWLVGLGRK